MSDNQLADLPLHQHHTIEGAVDCHVADCDVYQIQARARQPADLPLPEDAIQVAADTLAAILEPWLNVSVRVGLGSTGPLRDQMHTAAACVVRDIASALRAQGAAAERERCVALVRNEASEIRGDTAPLAQTIAIVLDDVADLLGEDQP